MPAIIGGALAGGGALLGAGSSLLGSGKASSAAKSAAGTQLQMYYANRATAQPYFSTGYDAVGNALNLAQSSLGGGFPTEAQTQQAPGYQFIRDEGLKAVQGAMAARGLGMSGASMKGAAQYATGLADQTYQNQFNDLQTNLTNQFNRLYNLSSLGENAAVGTGTQGTAAAATAGNLTAQSGVQQGTGLINAGNALNQGVQNYLGYNALQSFMNPQGGTSGYGSSAPGTPGISASGNPVMTGYAAPIVPGQVLPGGYVG